MIKCRVCLKHGEIDQLCQIFPDNCHLALWIFDISGVHIIETEECPAVICETCSQELEKAVNLRNNCKRAQEYFKSKIKTDFLDFKLINVNTIGIDNQSNSSELGVPEPETIEIVVQTEHDYQKQEDFHEINVKITPKKKSKEKCFCSKCCKSFCDGYLKKHEYFKHMEIPEVDLFECDCCGHRTKSKQLLRNHIITVHSEKPKEKFICGTCGLLLSSKGNLLCHENTHLEIDPSEYIPCPVCEKTFREKRFMIEHKKLVHDKSKRYQCPKCPHVSTCKGAFQKHNKSVHLKIRDFICSDCKAGFSTNSQLTRHYRIHTGEKPFSCINCSKSFRLSSHRKRHEHICRKKINPIND